MKHGRGMVLAGVLAVTGCQGGAAYHPAGPLDRTSAESTARAVMVAYQAKDLEGMGALSGNHNRELFKDLREQGDVHPKHGFMFTGKRWETIENWSGYIGPARYPDATTARVPYAETADRACVVELSWLDGQWCYEDIYFPTWSKFEAASLKRPQQR